MKCQYLQQFYTFGIMGDFNPLALDASLKKMLSQTSAFLSRLNYDNHG